MRYFVDQRRVAHQLVDDEVIAVDFVNGHYFSMRGTAAEIWQMLVNDMELKAVIAAYCAGNSRREIAIGADIQAFVEQAVAYGLLIPRNNDHREPPVEQSDHHQRHPFQKPELEKFEDMAALIMLDPVHDVSEVGWPHRPAGKP